MTLFILFILFISRSRIERQVGWRFVMAGEMRQVKKDIYEIKLAVLAYVSVCVHKHNKKTGLKNH